MFDWRHVRTREPRTHRGIRTLCLCVSVVCPFALVSPAIAQDVIERVMATAAGQVITLSDVRAALALGIVDSQPPEVEPNATQQLIDRALMLQEVARFAPPEPEPAAIDDRIARMRARFPSAAEFALLTDATGLEPTRLRDLARDDLRIQAYLTQRFGASGTPTEEEVVQYYRSHRDEFTVGGVLQRYDEVAAVARQRTAAQRRRAMIADWVSSLRSRADIRELYEQP